MCRWERGRVNGEEDVSVGKRAYLWGRGCANREEGVSMGKRTCLCGRGRVCVEEDVSATRPYRRGFWGGLWWLNVWAFS